LYLFKIFARKDPVNNDQSEYLPQTKLNSEDLNVILVCYNCNIWTILQFSSFLLSRKGTFRHKHAAHTQFTFTTAARKLCEKWHSKTLDLNTDKRIW